MARVYVSAQTTPLTGYGDVLEEALMDIDSDTEEVKWCGGGKERVKEFFYKKGEGRLKILY